jgi:hypothetical protein
MKVQSLVIDDFYKNPDEVRAFALSQEFTNTGNYPGRRTAPFLTEAMKNSIQEVIRPFAGNITWWGDDSTGAFQITTAEDRSWIHSDYTTDWAGVLYLTPDAPISGGTGIYKHKPSGRRNWKTSEELPGSIDPTGPDVRDMTKWELVDRFGNIYNRLIMYRGDLYHISLDYFGRDLQDGRLFQTFFFNTEK